MVVLRHQKAETKGAMLPPVATFCFNVVMFLLVMVEVVLYYKSTESSIHIHSYRLQ
jgi:hypothetical protein